MAGRRDGEALLCADQVAAELPRPARRSRARPDAAGLLRGSRLLSLRAALDAEARRLGFDVCRVASADAIPQAAPRLAQWLAEGAQGDMAWMAETATRRGAPQALWPQARSCVMLGANYGPEGDPLATLARRDRATISVYARNRDYHDVVKGRLKQLGQWLARRGGGALKVFVDTAPVMEKPLAQAAGFGWQGKHTNLVSRDFGSWLFLGALFTTLELAPDAPGVDRCGSCRACLDACPTRAFPAPYRLDARRCISYLTIEHRGPIAPEFRAAMGNRIYGCDDCLAVCPWNRFAQRAQEAKFHAREDLVAPALADLASLDDRAFRARFSGSPVKRVGRDRFVRNVMIAIGNSDDPALLPSVRRGLDDGAPLVRGMAAWALRRLAPQEFAAMRAARAAREDDDAARAEWSDDS